MSQDPRPRENSLNLNDRKKLIEKVKKSLEECEIGQKEQHLLISVPRGFCFYDFTRFFKQSWNKSKWNLHYKFAFVGECGADEDGVSRKFCSVMEMIHANRLQKYFLVPSSKYIKDEAIDLLKYYLLYIIYYMIIYYLFINMILTNR